jgi:hypothetical protein
MAMGSRLKPHKERFMDQPLSTPSGFRDTRSGGNLAVLLGGAVTIGLALLGVWALNQAGENVMGWYADYIFPAGAFLVGMVASLGFGITSYVTGTKISGTLLLASLVLLLAGYGLAQWLEFRHVVAGLPDGDDVSFWTYYDFVTRSFAWKRHGGERGEPLGGLGYGLRALEIIGFGFGGVLAPLVMRKMPYCDVCGVYKRSRHLALIPASVPARKINAKKAPEAAAAYAQESATAMQKADEALALLLPPPKGKTGADLRATCEAVGSLSQQRKTNKLPARIRLTLSHCRRCARGELRATLFTGQGNQIRSRLYATAPVERELVRELM